MLVRLSKLMSEKGICSRREADAYIEQGKVIVDGKVITELGTKVPPTADIRLTTDAQKQQENKRTILLNKPIGYVSTQPEKGYRAAIELLPKSFRQFHTAGRLDIDSKGLLVLTEDGTIVKQLIGNMSEIEKEYLVRIEGKITEGIMQKLRLGLSLDGKPLKPAKIDRLENQVLRFVLKEGKKRQIRRMCEKVGLKVIGLKRVRIGQIRLGKLPEGKWRFLKSDETF
jgi:23S rRNA pseudouridine2604 synthase